MMDPLERLAIVSSQIRCLEAELPALVAEARAAGASWSALARRLGVSRQAVQQRYGEKRADVESLPLSDPLFDPLFHPPKD